MRFEKKEKMYYCDCPSVCKKRIESIFILP